MDFMKVFDQTVREIKREVNLKVLKVPEIEQKVLDATDDEPWGPHGTVLSEIAQATKKFTECQLVMNVLWTRLTETGKDWRFVYKALAVIEYLVSNGSERAVDDIIEHTFQISSLASFEYVEPSGKDLGINVRKKAENIVALLNNKDKIQEVRNKASANREKYVGLSSTGITYKSGAASFSGGGARSSDRYGGFGSSGDSETFADSYKGRDQYGEDRYVKSSKSKKESSRYDSSEQDSPAAAASKTRANARSEKHSPVPPQSTSADNYDEDFDDFDPRGTSSAKPSTGSNQVDLFGGNFVDLFDAPVPVKSTTLDADTPEVDLFADAAFVSAPSEQEAKKAPIPQTNVDLFAQQPAPPAASATVDFFAAPDPAPHVGNNSSKANTSTAADPFAAVPLNNFDGSDPFGAFTSQTDSLSAVPNQKSSVDGNDGNLNGSFSETNNQPKKNAFQVKSGVWADSLSRGLIDLNISAPTKVNLTDVGIVGGLSDATEEKDKRPMPSFYMGGAAMGMGMGMGMGIGMGMGSGASKPSGGHSSSLPLDDDFFSSLSTGSQQHQYGSFQK